MVPQNITEQGQESLQGVRKPRGVVSGQSGRKSCVAERERSGARVKKLADESQSEWRKVRFMVIIRLVEMVEPAHRWHWEKVRRLQLVTPAGVRWDFRLNKGAWIRRAKVKHEYN